MTTIDCSQFVAVCRYGCSTLAAMSRPMASRKLMLTILSAFGDSERDGISERICGARRQMRAGCRSLRGNRPLGCRVNEAGKLVKVAKERAAIAEMRRLRKRGRSHRQIADELQKRKQ